MLDDPDPVAAGIAAAAREARALLGIPGVAGVNISGAASTRGYQPLSVWQEYAIDVRGEALPTGHFLPEEDPDLVTASLRDFLR